MFAKIDIVTPPDVEPVTVAELKEQTGIVDSSVPAEVTALNARLALLITAARERCEGFTRRSLITQDIDVWYDTWNGPGVIEDIPRGNIQSITGAFVYDDSGVETEVDSGIYSFAGNTILFSSWPPYFRVRLGIRLRIVSGYGDDPDDVPAILRQGILEYATFLHEYRLGEGPEVKYQAQATTGAIPSGVADKWRRYQIVLV